MTVTAREAFKLGFLQRCADEGLSPAQVELRIKRATMEDVWQALTDSPTVGKVTNWAKDHPLLATGSALGIGLGVPTLAGVGMGHLGRKLKGDFLDEEDVRKQELINEMRTLAARSQHSQSKALGL